jgi:hypothetical protein
MKKPVTPRIFALFFLYIAVFIILVMIQFTRQGGFTQQVGSFVVSGHYRRTEEPRAAPGAEHPLDGEITVFFGGMEFRLTDSDENSLGVLKPEGRQPVHPDSMTVSGDSALFRLSDGTELNFSTLFYGGVLELRISAAFAEEAEGLELPYRPLRTSRVRDSGDGEFITVADGTNYRFDDSTLDPERRLIILDIKNPAVSYGAVPANKTFNPEDFIISAAGTKPDYDETVNRWLDQTFSLWNRTIGNNPDENTVIAYLGESIRRGTYKAAISGVSPAFLGSNQTSYASSVFLGGMEQGRRSIAASERENFSRLSRLINEKSADFLKSNHVLEYLELHGYGTLINDAVEIVRNIDLANLTLDLAPGILEAHEDWKRFRPNTENPFERLIDQICFVISENLRTDADRSRVYVFYQETADPEFNLRLGAALTLYTESAGREEWTGIGRSLILSVLAQPDINYGRMYRLLRLGEYRPRAVSVEAGATGIWTWTAASAVQTRYTQTEEDETDGEASSYTIMDIAVSFPAGETHYMIIRGIRPFAQLRLYNIPFRTDPQFERYDSSGWSYSASEQTLVVKMKHQTTVEHIEIFYRSSAPRIVPPPTTVSPS